MKIINVARKICSLLFLILFLMNSSLNVYSEIKIVTNYTLNIIKINEVNYPNIAITVSVIDQNGNPVLNLSEKDFELYEDNEKQTILSIKPIKTTFTAKSIVMVLDCTGSMEGNPFEQLKNSTKKFISLLPAGWNVTLITIAGSVQEVISNNNNKEEMYQIIDSLEPDGGTPLYDAVYYGLQLAQNNKSINSIVLFSDGGDNQSWQSYNSVSALLNVVKIPIYTIGFLSGDTNIRVLQTLSDESKGIYFSSPDLVDFQAIFSQISSVIQNQYEITYQSSKPGKKGDKKTIIVRYYDDKGNLQSDSQQYSQPKDQDLKPLIIIPGIIASWPIGANLKWDAAKEVVTVHSLTPFHQWSEDGKELEIINQFGGTEYHKLAERLVKYGNYELNKNLFLFPYNWTKPCQINAYYLHQYISKIKNYTGQESVDLIAHSMGGLVARSYIEGFASQNDSIVFHDPPVSIIQSPFRSLDINSIDFSTNIVDSESEITFSIKPRVDFNPKKDRIWIKFPPEFTIKDVLKSYMIQYNDKKLIKDPIFYKNENTWIIEIPEINSIPAEKDFFITFLKTEGIKNPSKSNYYKFKVGISEKDYSIINVPILEKAIPYENDVRKLIILGTPNQGSLDTYRYYKYNKDNNYKMVLEDYVADTFFNIAIKRSYQDSIKDNLLKNTDSYEDYIHLYLPSVRQLLPSQYNYLIDKKTKKQKPIDNYIKNYFIENLNYKWRKRDNYYFLIGNRSNTFYQAIEEVRSIKYLEIDEGDGRVLSSSVLPPGMESNHPNVFYYDHVTHSKLVSNNKTVERMILLLTSISVEINEKDETVKNSLLVQILSPANGYLISPSKKKIGFVHETAKVVNEINQSTYWGPATKDNQDGIETFLIENPEEGEYELITKGFESGKVTIITNLITNDGAQERKTSFFTKPEKTNSTKISLKSDNNGKTALSYIGLPSASMKIPKKNSLLLIMVMIIIFSVLLIPIILSSSSKNRPKSKIPFILYHNKKYLIHHSLTIGRSSSNDIVIDDPMISRQHAVIHYHFPQAEIQNLSKTNAIFVNGKKTTKSALYPYDSIMIGQHILIYHE